MQTPRSDAALERFPEFCGRIEERLYNGKRVYGDASFERPLASLVEEIRQEALDVAGWAFILYERLAELDTVVSLQTSAMDSISDEPRLTATRDSMRTGARPQSDTLPRTSEPSSRVLVNPTP